MYLDERIFNEQVNIGANDLQLLETIDCEKYCDLVNGISENLEEDEDIWELLGSGHSFNLIDVDGVLYQALLKYYGSKAEMMENVRGGYFVDVDIKRFFVWERGLGYNIIDADLLNGDGSGETIKKFLEKINSETI